MSTPLRTSRTYIYPMLIVLGMPCLCGMIIITTSWLDARHNVHVWRQEFQFALDQQCPQLDVDILGGAGKVYLDAYQLDYQWVDDELSCSSNGRMVGCSCRAEGVEETEVTKGQKEE